MIIQLRFNENDDIQCEDLDQAVFRYQNNINSFYEGNIWFAGVNQNRFFQNDPYECCDYNGIRTNVCTLSLTYLSPNENFDGYDKRPMFHKKPCIEIPNINIFLRTLTNDMKLNDHEIEFFQKEELEFIVTTQIDKIIVETNNLKSEIARFGLNKSKQLILQGLKRRLIHHNNILNGILNCNIGMLDKPLNMNSYILSGRTISYYNPSKIASAIGVDSVQRVLSIDQRYSVEKEFRVDLNLFPSSRDIDSTWYNLVKYVKLDCPNIKKCLTL